jgi:hypothetical protein
MFFKNIIFLIFFCLFGLTAIADIPGSISIPDTVQTDYCGIDIGGGSSNMLLDPGTGNALDDNKLTLDETVAAGNSSVVSIDAADPIDPGRHHECTTMCSHYIARLSAIPIMSYSVTI